MNDIRLIHGSCPEQKVDVIVNAANDMLSAGGGICGAIFRKAGVIELTHACDKINKTVKTGHSVITPAFNIENAKAIIHAFEPDFAVEPSAFHKLFNAYYNYLVIAKESGFHSISFPLISSGIYGGSQKNPVGESTKQCGLAFKSFKQQYEDYEMSVSLCAYSIDEYEKSIVAFNRYI